MQFLAHFYFLTHSLKKPFLSYSFLKLISGSLKVIQVSFGFQIFYVPYDIQSSSKVQMIYQEIHRLYLNILNFYFSHFLGKSHLLMCILEQLEQYNIFPVAKAHKRNKSLVETFCTSAGLLSFSMTDYCVSTVATSVYYCDMFVFLSEQ